VSARFLQRARLMDRTAEDLKARTKRFAIAVLDFVETLPRTIGAEALARQLSRSGMGVAGNYRASCRARSHTEFTARLGVVLEEADESELWIDVAGEKQWGEPKLRRTLHAESGELLAIFSKACMTARLREHRHRE
jgi:four helix bundle protein